MTKKNLKILLVCIVNRNYGDSIIADCTEYLIRKALGRHADENSVLRYKIDSGDLWQIQFADAVVFAGGGLLKFRQEKFYSHVCDIIEEAQRFGIPVFMNSVGVEGFDEDDERCVMLKAHVNYDCVKAITIRDDTELFLQKYKENPKLRVKSVFDPAVWVKDVYNSDHASDGLVGINVARGNLFPDYGNDRFDESFMLDFWTKIVALLEKNGYRWKIFTNGGKGDEIFASKLMEKLGHGEKLPAPHDSKTLVGNISMFSSVIALRMHACITAFSLGIPCVGLEWNNKIRMWSRKIKSEAFYISPEDLSAENVYNAFVNAVGGKRVKSSFFKRHGVYSELKRFIGKYAQNRNVGRNDLPDKIFDVGLGGIQHRYKAPNSLDELERRLARGSRFFEVDVRADTDGKSVCINGWSEKNLRLLGFTIENTERKERSAEELKNSLLDGAFRMGTLEDAAEIISKYRAVKLILDVGLPPADLKEAFFEDIALTLKKYSMDSDRTFIRLQREGDIKLWQNQDCFCRLIYFYPESGDTEESMAKQKKALSVCKKYDIDYISVSEKNFTEDTARIMKEKKLRPVVFSYEKLGDAAEAVDRGAALAGSFYYSSFYTKNLTKSDSNK